MNFILRTVVVSALALVAFPRTGFAYPEMVRHSYSSCATCHYSPDGGGLLTGYGRALSAEVLSTWHTETEGEFLYGVVKPPEFLSFGGQFRVIQTYVNNASIEQARTIWMQSDVEAGVTIAKKFVLVGSFGYDDFSDKFLSRRHYIRYQPDMKLPLYFRAGRFFPSYGTHYPDHVLWVRSRLSLTQPLKEPYSFEASYMGPDYQAVVTGFLSRPDDATTDSGASLKAEAVVGKSAKAGASVAYTTRGTQNRVLFGPHAIIGFTPQWFLLAEMAFQRATTMSTGVSTWSAFTYTRLDYELLQGVHVYGVAELGRSNLRLPALSQGFGAGAQFFPRPHIEIRAEYQRQRGDRPSWSDVAWLMGYYYL